MSDRRRQIWRTTWRLAICSLLLLWIFHSIFVNEARQLVGPDAFRQLPRLEQWRQGWGVGPKELLHALTRVGLGHFVVSIGLVGLVLAAGVIRWRMTLSIQDIHLSWERAFEISAVAHFFNSFLLGSTGGDVMKAWYVTREAHQKKTEAIVTVAVDRLLGLWAMLLFGCVMMGFNLPLLLSQRWLRLISALVVLLMVMGSLVLGFAFWGGLTRHWAGARRWLHRIPKGESIAGILDSCRKFGQAPGFVLRALLLSMVLNFFCVLQFFVLNRGMNLGVSLLLLLAIVPTVICISALPITPGGLGLRENLFVQMLALVGIAPTAALSLSLLAYAGSLFWGLIGGIVYITVKDKHPLSKADWDDPSGGESQPSLPTK